MKPPSTIEPPHQQEPNLPALPYQQFDLDNPGPSKNHWLIWLIVFGLIGYGCYRLYLFEGAKEQTASAKKGMMKGLGSVPVAAVAAQR